MTGLREGWAPDVTSRLRGYEFTHEAGRVSKRGGHTIGTPEGIRRVALHWAAFPRDNSAMGRFKSRARAMKFIENA